MFHVECLVDDKDVVKLHYALAGLRVFNVEIKPANNAKAARNGKAVEVVPGGGTVADQVANAVRENHQAGSKITRKAIFELARSMSYSPNSLLATSLVKMKVIKKTKGRGEFIVLAS